MKSIAERLSIFQETSKNHQIDISSSELLDIQRHFLSGDYKELLGYINLYVEEEYTENALFVLELFQYLIDTLE